MRFHGKDISEKKLTSYDDVFAEIFNSLVFYGTGLVIDPDDLEDARTRSAYVPLSEEENQVREQERDVAKFWKKEGVILCLMGLENQTEIDKYMTLRIMGYEGADYRSQITERDEAMRAAHRRGDKTEAGRIRARKFYPVITAVVYYGIKRRWNKYKSLHECLDIPEGLKYLVEDRHINIIELAWLSDEERSRLKGDARLLADALRQMRIYGKLMEKDLRIVEHVEAMLMFLKEVTGNMDLFREGILKYEEAEREGRRVAMIDFYGGAYRGGYDAGLEEGLSKGLAEGISKGLAEGISKGFEEGISKGLAEGLSKGLALLKKFGASPEDLAEFEASYRDTSIGS